MRRDVLCVLLLQCITLKYSAAQTATIENIKRKITASRNDGEKLKAIFELGEQRQSLNADTLYYYADIAKKITVRNNDSYNTAWADYYLISGELRRGELDRCLSEVDGAMTIAAKYSQDELLLFNLSRLKATILIRKNQYKDAMSEFYSILHRSEQNDDTLMRVVATNGIGWVYMEMDQNRDAISWFRDCIHITNSEYYYKIVPQPFSNLAATYNTIDKNDSAEYFIRLAIRFCRSAENLSSLANSLNILAGIYIDTDRKPLAEETLNEALNIREKIGDPFYIVSDMYQMAIFYAKNDQSAKGIALSNKGITMANKYSLTSKLPILYDALAENYKAARDYEKYSETLKHIISLKDSLYKINSEAALADVQTRYEVQRQENIITRQKFVLEKNNYLLYGSLALLLFVIIFAAILFNEYGKHQRMQVKMMMETERRGTELAIATAEENQRNRIAADIHDNLGVKANAILYSTELLQQDTSKNETMLSDLRDTAKDMLLTLRETLWAMKTADVEGTDMWLRVINFSKQISRYYPHIKISAQGSAPEMYVINSGVALNSLLIIQEAVNNAVRHASASTILITSAIKDQLWEMQVEDDGIGFDVEAMQKKQDSYGLNNMVNRAKTANLYIEINTKPLHGTIVTIRIPSVKPISK
jgi:signal transduction histidine kinase